MAEPLIEFRDLRKSFGDNAVLKGVDLTFHQGEITTIIGKSGVGKSVMIKHIVGLLEPDSGEILVRGRPLSKMDKGERKAFKGRVSYMFQSNALFDSMTVFDNVALPLRERRHLPESEVRGKVLGLLEILELPHVTDRYPSQLSGGMQKRVALARALISEPEIVLFDEPTTGLDPLRKNAVLAMISRYQRHFGFTAIMVSHDVPDVFYISNRIAILEGGEILFQGSPVDLERSGNSVAVEFLASLERLENEIMGLLDCHELSAALAGEPDGGAGRPAALLAVEDMAGVKASAGDIGAHKVLDACISLARDHAGKDALLARTGAGEFLCLLPRGEDKEVERFLTDISRDLKDGSARCCLSASIDLSVGVLGGRADLDAVDCREAARRARAGSTLLGRMQCGWHGDGGEGQ
ncbi:ABC transporter related protein [Desulfovibrio sp. X2]|uniref:ABC transporter ATP-binding protein n=1 Tax=Desulfovibrio sp. X2 TaxID=941449 RepID=UPI000358AE76|nr:ATP-binding cassette domain-containing protein [Desulfovibrio sp. X2]EPR44753.1 ABC transporter related protein [Desulfovibrio sp. X2]